MLETTLQESLSTELGNYLVLKEETSPIPERVDDQSLLTTLGVKLDDVSFFPFAIEILSDCSEEAFCDELIRFFLVDASKMSVVLKTLESSSFERFISDFDTTLF